MDNSFILTIDSFCWNKLLCELTFRGYWKWGQFPEKLYVKGKKSLVLFLINDNQDILTNEAFYYTFFQLIDGETIPTNFPYPLTLRIPWYKIDKFGDAYKSWGEFVHNTTGD